MKFLSQIPWDPTRFIGFSNEQIELIKKGWDLALDDVYRLEKEKANGERSAA